MQNHFKEFRKWRRVQIVCAIAVLCLVPLHILYRRECPLIGFVYFSAIIGVAICGLVMYHKSKCPYCGKSMMSIWGFDDLKRSVVLSIQKRLSVICYHCGKAVETEE